MPLIAPQSLTRLLLCAVLAAHYPAVASATYSATEFTDPSTGNVEQQLFLDDFHWGSLIETAAPEHAVVIRFHPGRDPNGWGTSWYPSPFLAGGAPRDSRIQQLVVDGDGGISVVTVGAVDDGLAGAFGSFTLNLHITFDPWLRQVTGAGTLAVDLDGGLAERGHDLNVGRIASNFLRLIPVQTAIPGEVGNTGDMRVVDITRDLETVLERWDPATTGSHVPGERSEMLTLNVVGATNTVDTLALSAGFQIAIAEKPSFALTLVAPTPVLSAGLFYDIAQSQNFAADNIGVVSLIVYSGQIFQPITLALDFRAAAPIPVPPALISFMSALLVLVGGYARARWPRRSVA